MIVTVNVDKIEGLDEGKYKAQDVLVLIIVSPASAATGQHTDRIDSTNT